MNQRQREQVYHKFGGRCAYCGQRIQYKNMQVDHFTPVCNRGNGDVSNLMPSCRRCNHYKRGHSPEYFRHMMVTLHTRIEEYYINKVGLDFGIVTIKPFDGVFYFEKFIQNYLT